MRSTAWVTVPLLILSLAGAYLSKLLMDRHMFRTAGPAWFNAGCGEPAAESTPDVSPDPPPTASAAVQGDGGSRDCGAVLASRWATLPPRSASPTDVIDEGGSEKQPQLRMPVAMLGIFYFLTLAIWFLLIGRPTPDKPEWFRLPLVFVAGGVLFSLAYLTLMLTGMDAWCPWCLVTHVINFLILGGMFLLKPGRGYGEPAAVAPHDAAVAGSTMASHPSGRLVAAVVLLAIATGAAVANHYSTLSVMRTAERTKAYLDRFIKDSDLLTALYFNKPKVEIDIRPDDPQTSQDRDYCELVVFSDFACPACHSFSHQFKSRILPLFQNHVRFVWKHFPLSTDCNPHATSNKHPEGCQAARAAEAARRQGGNEAFWKFHDRLFESHESLKDMDFAAVARDMGLDPERFLSDMASEEVAERIRQDADQGKALGVNGTPTIFLMGRRVEPLLIRVMHFWTLMAHSFNYDYDQKVYAEKMKRLESERKPPTATRPKDGAGD